MKSLFGSGRSVMDWEDIKTIAKFDEDMQLHFRDNKSGAQSNGSHSNSFKYKAFKEFSTNKISTPASLLIESLIQLLCLSLERDKKQANQSYREVCDQLNQIGLIDDSYLINEFDEMRSQYQMQIYRIICAVKEQSMPMSLPSAGKESAQLVQTCWSRYYREFDEISYIASGGFGKVFRARHKLDSIEYAVKQIKINSTTIKLCHLAEVKTIASLNHPNVVQYKAAWLEPYLAICSSVESDHETTELDLERSNILNNKSCITNNYLHNVDSSDFIHFENIASKTETGKDSSFHNLMCKCKNNSSVEIGRQKPKVGILYIQMALCQITLQKWLYDRDLYITFEDYYDNFFRNNLKSSHFGVVNNIFFQMLAGLNYIHSRNIVHHDIKPSNVFVGLENSERIIVQLGDFGLACPLQSAHQDLALGTPLYAAPEQLNGHCNPKSDIYSLGIVLLELILKFTTNMERVKTIEAARKGKLPKELNKKYTKLLKSLLSCVEIRPSSKELFKALQAVNLDHNVSALKVPQVDLKLRERKIKKLEKEIYTLHEDDIQNKHRIEDLLKNIKSRDLRITELNILLMEKDKQISELSEIVRTLGEYTKCI